MPEQALRIVLSFDHESQSFKPRAHNLPLNQAGSFADDLHNEDKVDCRIIQQKTRHKAANAETCSPCNKAAAAETKKLHTEQSQLKDDSASGEANAAG